MKISRQYSCYCHPDLTRNSFSNHFQPGFHSSAFASFSRSSYRSVTRTSVPPSALSTPACLKVVRAMCPCCHLSESVCVCARVCACASHVVVNMWINTSSHSNKTSSVVGAFMFIIVYHPMALHMGAATLYFVKHPENKNKSLVISLNVTLRMRDILLNLQVTFQPNKEINKWESYAIHTQNNQLIKWDD